MSAGLRRGLVTGRLAVEPDGAGSLLVFTAEESRYRLNGPAVVILLFGAVGAVGATLWPFFPRLLGFAPLAVVLALGAWFLVVSRVRSSTPEDFLGLVELVAAGPPE